MGVLFLFIGRRYTSSDDIMIREKPWAWIEAQARYSVQQGFRRVEKKAQGRYYVQWT
jgi:hypothetical protein